MPYTPGIRHATGSSDGAPISIVSENTAAPTSIDVAVAGATHFDLEILEVQNVDAIDVDFYLVIGGVAQQYVIPAYGSRTFKLMLNDTKAVGAAMGSTQGGKATVTARVIPFTFSA
jgi:hypothetical protein